jgi:hypothetical protein
MLSTTDERAARCTTSVAPVTARPTAQGDSSEPSMISICPRIAARFAALPVLKSSSTRTRTPRATSASQRCDPMNPAPPVTRTRRALLSLRSFM